MSKTITFSKLNKLSVTNSKKLPQRVKIKHPLKEGEYYYKEWVGIGWIDIDEPEDHEDLVEVIE